MAAAADVPLAIDTSLVFHGLGRSGRAHGSVAQVSFILVPGTVTMDGMSVTPALGYASPVNIQAVGGAARAVATGDFAVRGEKVEPMLRAFAAHGITAAEALRLLEGLCASRLDRPTDWIGSQEAPDGS